MQNHQFVLIVDFGGQYNQLIARRVNAMFTVRSSRTQLRLRS